MKRQRCDPSFVPSGHLDRHPELGITTKNEYYMQLQKRRDFKYYGGRTINKNMISADYPFETSGSRYQSSNQLLIPSSKLYNNATENQQNISTSNFFRNFGDGNNRNYSNNNIQNNNNSSIGIQRNGDKVNNIKHEENHTLEYHRLKQQGVYQKIKNIAQQRSNVENNTLPVGPYVKSEVNGWCVPYQARRMKSSSETNLRGISKHAPEWFHANNNSRVNNEAPKGHALRQNGRKEQVMSNLVPEFFVGERVTMKEEEYRQKNEGRGKMMKGKKRSPYMERKILQPQISLPKNQGKQHSPEASHKILQSNVTFSEYDKLENESDALENLLLGNHSKKLACKLETAKIIEEERKKSNNDEDNNNRTNNNENNMDILENNQKNNDKNDSIANDGNTAYVYLRDGQISYNKPEWMKSQWSEERPTIKRKIPASEYRLKRNNTIANNMITNNVSSPMKLQQSEERKKQLSFAGLWTLGYPGINK